jgi:hypothetical protein
MRSPPPADFFAANFTVLLAITAPTEHGKAKDQGKASKPPRRMRRRRNR